MDGWMGRRGEDATVLAGRQSEKRTERGRRPVGGCGTHKDTGRYCFGLGRCGSARSNIQAGYARAHTAAVPVLWEQARPAKSAVLRPAPSSSLESLPPSPASTSVFCFVGTLLYS